MKTENYRPHYEGVSLELADLEALQPHLSYSWQPLLINQRPPPIQPPALRILLQMGPQITSELTCEMPNICHHLL